MCPPIRDWTFHEWVVNAIHDRVLYNLRMPRKYIAISIIGIVGFAAGGFDLSVARCMTVCLEWTTWESNPALL